MRIIQELSENEIVVGDFLPPYFRPWGHYLPLVFIDLTVQNGYYCTYICASIPN